MVSRNGCMNAFIALGSNLGDSARLLEDAFRALQELSTAPIRRSSLWRSSPVDCPPGSPPFLNAVAAIEPRPGTTPEALLEHLQALERTAGRRPKQVLNEARPLDLDLIAFGDEVRGGPFLILPHPRAQARRFVLAPLEEIAPTFVFPGQTMTVRERLLTLVSEEAVVRVEAKEENQRDGRPTPPHPGPLPPDGTGCAAGG